VEKFAAGWQLVALRRDRRGAATLATRCAAALAVALRPATLTLAGRDDPRARAARLGAPARRRPTEVLAELAAALGLDSPQVLAFADARRGISKRALIEDGALVGALLCNETRATDWLADLIATGGRFGGGSAELRKWIFAPLAAPPSGAPSRGRIVCNCFDVSENEIRADLARRPRPCLPELQDRGARQAQVRQRLRLLPAGFG
jgi:hypothetical protein